MLHTICILASNITPSPEDCLNWGIPSASVVRVDLLEPHTYKGMRFAGIDFRALFWRVLHDEHGFFADVRENLPPRFWRGSHLCCAQMIFDDINRHLRGTGMEGGIPARAVADLIEGRPTDGPR